MDLSDSERTSMISSAVLIQYTRVTDGRTELAWHIRAIIYAVARKNDTATKDGGNWKVMEEGD